MQFLEKNKALLITVLLSGTVLMALFSLHITKKAEFLAESYFEIEPQTEEELKELQEQELIEEKGMETNQAFNEDQEFKEMMQNFKTASNAPVNESNQAEQPPQEESSESTNDVLTSNSEINASKNYSVDEQERKSFNKAKDILAMHSPKKSTDKSISNKNSSVSFSLKNRNKVNLPPPVYLCETSGKIVVNIKVDSNGRVTDAYLNTSSSSKNQCLVDSALDYARNAIFSADAKKTEQIGSITYYFKGKR